jgi:iron-sulfur cluster repair protein YtfE (RIC family)
MDNSETIASFMAKDHDRLDSLFAEFQKLGGENPSRARAAFAEFSGGLLRHIDWEETLLFPIFEKHSGQTAGPTRVMRMEHVQIKGFLDRLGAPGGAEPGQTQEALLAVLHGHNQKEESVLYPWIDEAVSDDERQAVIETMRTTPAAR